MLRNPLSRAASSISGGACKTHATPHSCTAAVSFSPHVRPTTVRSSLVDPSRPSSMSIGGGVVARRQPPRPRNQIFRSLSTSSPRIASKKPSHGPRPGKAITTSILLSAVIGTILGFGLAKSSLLAKGDDSEVHGDNGGGGDEPKFGSPEEFALAIIELKETFAESSGNVTVSDDPDELHNHGFSENDHHPGVNPSVVVYPSCTEDVVKIVKIATRYRMPVIPYSGATSLEGQYRGIDPAPGATIGGMLSTGCSGTNAVRYGTAKAEWFLNATVVLPSGEVIKTRQRSRKSSTGFDTTKLFIGAEGTLGIVTEVTIRLTPLLPTTVAVVQFPDVQKATEAVIDVLKTGVGIQCVELVDNVFMAATNKYGMSKRKWPEKDSLFFKFQGPTPASLKESAAITKKIVEKHGGTGFQLARNDQEASDLWADRKNAHYSGLAYVEGSKGWPTDVCVPISKLPQLLYETKEDIAQSGLVSTIVGHVGDGNFHAMILFKTEEEKEIAKELVKRMVKRAIALDGTCTGEHGVGIGKKEYLVEELGEGTVELMKKIKRTIDPLGLFNPGK
ncbi:hypothetical protein CVT24_007578 [Panaeolus cyanescens]|uniref:D-lactate dehydrogenase (cytochrome) n=1 Tax=Panaeolus cyanescens TaxID=181874 RepID=A0A409VR40_9AGAR|nr:hypothetical protein CVT24_007578 [Panaeolus cyanescens]